MTACFVRYARSGESLQQDQEVHGQGFIQGGVGNEDTPPKFIFPPHNQRIIMNHRSRML